MKSTKISLIIFTALLLAQSALQGMKKFESKGDLSLKLIIQPKKYTMYFNDYVHKMESYSITVNRDEHQGIDVEEYRYYGGDSEYLKKAYERYKKENHKLLNLTQKLALRRVLQLDHSWRANSVNVKFYLEEKEDPENVHYREKKFKDLTGEPLFQEVCKMLKEEDLKEKICLSKL